MFDASDLLKLMRPNEVINYQKMLIRNFFKK